MLQVISGATFWHRMIQTEYGTGALTKITQLEIGARFS